ncbi:hypothetical protein MNBD_PLANCTO03-2186 [hydrothermal vent metagenome]|uniref:Uncharacterized protein n=1 Tax=hydrothermal vent metagenome TaxID=652676 RepID=A0A3B1DZD7_9ZZZZ
MVQLISSKPDATLFDSAATISEPPPPEATPPETIPSEASTALSRPQLFDRIMVINTSATEEYLDSFSDRSLARYLAHLDTLGSPRGTRRERPGDSPAILVRETAI